MTKKSYQITSGCYNILYCVHIKFNIHNLNKLVASCRDTSDRFSIKLKLKDNEKTISECTEWFPANYLFNIYALNDEKNICHWHAYCTSSSSNLSLEIEHKDFENNMDVIVTSMKMEFERLR